MRAYRKKIAISVASALALVSTQSSVFAQEETEEDGGFETIQVTAQKRVERISDVPVAVSVLRSEQIDSTFSSNFEGLQNLVPSVSFRKGTTTRNSAITVRGIGTISFSVAAEPSVSTVVDGVVLGRSGQAFTDLYDLERIEVLRGPQGTLFGKNASAGVVNITTKRPTGATEGMIEATLFQDNEYKVRGKIQGEITDTAAGSLVFTKSAFDGNIFNVFNNNTVNGYDKQGLRGMLDVDVTDSTKMLFIFESMESDDDCCADVEGRPSNRNPSSEAAPTNGTDLDLNQRLIDHDFESRTMDEQTSFSVQLDTEFENFTLTSITAYRTWDNTELREGDFTSIAGDSNERVTFNNNPPFQLHDVGPQSWDQFSQELRLASTTQGTFDWQVGMYIWDMSSERSFTRDASCQDNNRFNADGSINPRSHLKNAIRNHLITVEDVNDPSDQQVIDFIASEGITCNANDIVSATAFMETEFNNWAMFADFKYHVTDHFRLLAGIRYTDDEVSYKHNRVNNDEFGRKGVGVREASLNTNFSGKVTETDVSVKLGAQYDLEEAGMVYATYSEGYKGPGFNVFYNMSENDTRPIGAETSDAYELGYKYASRDVLFNAAIFRTEIDGFQANNFDNTGGVTITRLTNAGSVITEGYEADILWQAGDNLTINAGFASVDAEIDQFLCPLNEPDCGGRAGADVPFSPDRKYSLGVDYVHEMDNMNMIYNASYVYTDEQVADFLDPGVDRSTSPLVLPDYGLLSASVAFSFRDDMYRVSLIGKNLTDQQFFTTYSGDGFRYQAPRDANRYFGVQFRANF